MRAARRGSPVAVAGAALGAAVLLAAAGTAALVKMPPFQLVEPDMYRTQTAIAVDYRSVIGHENHCQAFLEFTNLSVAQINRADALVKRYDWSGVGQAAYDRAAAGRTDIDVIDGQFTHLLGQRLRSVAVTGMPGIASSRIGAGAKPAWSGYSFSCTDGQK